MKKMNLISITLISILMLTAAGCDSFKKKTAEESQEEQTEDVAEDTTVVPPEQTVPEKQEEQPAAAQPVTKPATEVKEVKEVKTEAPKTTVKNFTMTASQFSFSPNSITVNEGDTVRINITGKDVTHGFILSDFGINKTIPAGSTVTVEFVADKKGTFTFRCSVFCGENHGSMAGTLVVK